MPKPVLVVRVVLISPGDVKEERKCVVEAVEEINKLVARPAELYLELIRWETDSRPGVHKGGPQALIDPKLKIPEADVVIAIFWSRLGTAMPTGETGSEHEFNTAFNAWEENQRPQIMAYFCNRAPDPKSDDDREQLAKLQGFRANFPKEALKGKYSDPEEFRKLLRQDLATFVHEQIQEIWSLDAVRVREMVKERRNRPPVIAILGRTSVHGRDPALSEMETCVVLLREIGARLASSGCHLMVFDSSPEFAGVEVVRGYVDSGKGQEGGIHIRRPIALDQAEFPGQKESPGLFLEEAQAGEWEGAFVPSLSDTDGVVLAGNGYFTLLGGLQCVGARLPMIALAGFGGVTKEVWQALNAQGFSPANKSDLSLMSQRRLTPDFAQDLVKSLLAQKKRREALQIWRD